MTHSDTPVLECTVRFLTAEEGGRAFPLTVGAMSGDGYRPHAVVGTQDTKMEEGSDPPRISDEYLGVSFHEGPSEYVAGEDVTARLRLVYYPYAGYDALQPGTEFTVREGARVVARGKVLRWI